MARKLAPVARRQLIETRCSRTLRGQERASLPKDGWTTVETTLEFLALALVAQLDRASDYGSEGWGFEYLRARYITAGQRPPKRRDSTGRAVETSRVDTEAHVGEPLTLKLIPGFVWRQFAARGFSADRSIAGARTRPSKNPNSSASVVDATSWPRPSTRRTSPSQ